MGSTFSSRRHPLLPISSDPPPSYSSVVNSSSALPFESREIVDTDTLKLGLDMDSGRFSGRSRWIGLAVASGGCAAFNGVFAKL